MNHIVKSTLKNARITPRKSRLVLAAIKGKTASEALNTLSFCKLRAGEIVLKVLQSALASIKKQQGSENTNKIIVVNAYSDVGSKLKRYRPGSHGKAEYFLRRNAHITILIKDIESYYGS